MRPAGPRLALVVGGLASAALGVFVYRVLHDGLQAGDPASPLIGGGFVTLIGAGAGALVAAMTPGPEGRVPAAWNDPALGVGFGPGEPEPRLGVGAPSLRWALSPSFALSPLLRIRPRIELRHDVGVRVVPDAAGASPSAGPLGTLREDHARLGVDLWLTPPMPAASRPGPFSFALGLRHRAGILRAEEGRVAADRGAVEFVGVEPATLGLSLLPSARQRLDLWMGLRLDSLSFTDRGETEVHTGTPYLGDLVAEVRWTQIAPLPPGPHAVDAHARFELAYVHDRTEGVSFGLGAAAGFFGPLEVAATVHIGPAVGRWAVRAGVLGRIGDGGSIYGVLALVPGSAPIGLLR